MALMAVAFEMVVVRSLGRRYCCLRERRASQTCSGQSLLVGCLQDRQRRRRCLSHQIRRYCFAGCFADCWCCRRGRQHSADCWCCWCCRIDLPYCPADCWCCQKVHLCPEWYSAAYCCCRRVRLCLYFDFDSDSAYWPCQRDHRLTELGTVVWSCRRGLRPAAGSTECFQKGRPRAGSDSAVVHCCLLVQIHPDCHVSCEDRPKGSEVRLGRVRCCYSCSRLFSSL